MTKYAIKYALMFVILVVAQAVVFNHMVLFGVAVPLVFLYLIISLPVTAGTNISVARPQRPVLHHPCLCPQTDVPSVREL